MRIRATEWSKWGAEIVHITGPLWSLENYNERRHQIAGGVTSLGVVVRVWDTVGMIEMALRNEWCLLQVNLLMWKEIVISLQTSRCGRRGSGPILRK